MNMTVRELIKELEDYPKNATINSIRRGEKELFAINCEEPITLIDDDTGNLATGKEWVITL